MNKPLNRMIVLGTAALMAVGLATAATPNIVFVFCDDLGYGDIHCLNPERGLIATPSADMLADEGMIFTDAHSSSSVCTPSRYALLTGRYNWRTTKQSGVVSGGSPDLIVADRPTVASFLKGLGYHTAILGKWHLNFQYLDPDTGSTLKGSPIPVGALIPDGPIHRGFDYFHGFHHAGSMEVVIEDDEVIEHDDRINMLPRLTNQAVEYINERAATPNTPFFLYVALGSPHTPIVPSAAWQGASGDLGAYADFVMETDAALGAVMDALEDNGLDDNTLLIFSSDNGCSPAAGFSALEAKGHYPSAHFRGAKADIWDGGHRVPFIVRWPGNVIPGTISDQTICLVDFMATLSEITATDLPAGSAEDSVSFLPALSNNPIVSTRSGVIHHSISGHFGYRLGKWKLMLARGSGGWAYPEEDEVPADSLDAQLYDMENDPSETTNLYETEPDVVRYLLRQLESDVARGRSTDGAPATNDTNDIVLWKNGVPDDIANELVTPLLPNLTTVDSNNLSPAIDSNNLDKFDGDGEPFATTLYVRGSSNEAARVRALLKFDLSALDVSSVASATLHLNGYSLNDYKDDSLQALALAESLAEATYDIATLGSVVDGGSVITGLDSDQIRDYSLDVTEMVAAWQNESWTNHGMVLQLSNQSNFNGVGFQLSGVNAPWLEVIESTQDPVSSDPKTVDPNNLSPAIGSNNLDKFDGDGEPFATTLYVRAGSEAARVRALLKFDLSELDASPVVSATLHLNGYSLNDSNDDSLQALALAESSAEAIYDIATQGAAVDGGSVITGLDADLLRDYSLDVTEMVAAWQDGSWINHGMVLRLSNQSNSNGVGFELSGGNAPLLEVNGVGFQLSSQMDMNGSITAATTQVPFVAATAVEMERPLQILQHQLLQEPEGPNHLFSLIYQAESAGTYYLQSSPNLESGSWSTIYSQESASTVDRFSISVGTEPAAFFRVSDQDAQ